MVTGVPTHPIPRLRAALVEVAAGDGSSWMLTLLSALMSGLPPAGDRQGYAKGTADASEVAELNLAVIISIAAPEPGALIALPETVKYSPLSRYRPCSATILYLVPLVGMYGTVMLYQPFAGMKGTVVVMGMKEVGGC